LYNKSIRKLITVGKVGKSMFKRLMTFCLVVILGCFAVTAQATDRWKWYYSSDYYGHYYDTQTVQYQASAKGATVWTKLVKADGTLVGETRRFLDFGHKLSATVEEVTYYNGYPRRYRPSKLYPSFVVPDSPEETLTRLVADQLHISPMFTGGEDRWKWVHATDRWSLYVAKDTLTNMNKPNIYFIWAKRVYLNGGVSKFLYICDTARNVIGTRSSGWNSPLPDSDEEAILNAVKAMNVGA
jgi:hypothetical protein